MTQNLQFHHSTVKDVFATQESPVEAAYMLIRALGTTSKYSSSPDRDPGLKCEFVGTTQTKHNRETNGGAEQCNILRSVSHFFRLFQQKVSLQNELMAETNLTLTFGNDSVAELLMFDLCSLQKWIHSGGALIFNLVGGYCQLLSRKLREKEIEWHLREVISAWKLNFSTEHFWISSFCSAICSS